MPISCARTEVKEKKELVVKRQMCVSSRINHHHHNNTPDSVRNGCAIHIEQQMSTPSIYHIQVLVAGEREKKKHNTGPFKKRKSYRTFFFPFKRGECNRGELLPLTKQKEEKTRAYQAPLNRKQLRDPAMGIRQKCSEINKRYQS